MAGDKYGSVPTANGSHKGKVRSPAALAHIVLRTANYDTMIDFWTVFLGAEVTSKDDVIAFLRYDFEHHRVAIVNIPATVSKVPNSAGLEHVAFTFESLDDLVGSYEERKALGITPFWCVNHGPTTSMYYKDPDGNSVETQVDNFDTAEDANEFMISELFKVNPIGTDFDPDELLERVRAGVDPKEIKKRVEIGPRSLLEPMK